MCYYLVENVLESIRKYVVIYWKSAVICPKMCCALIYCKYVVTSCFGTTF